MPPSVRRKRDKRTKIVPTVADGRRLSAVLSILFGIVWYRAALFTVFINDVAQFGRNALCHFFFHHFDRTVSRRVPCAYDVRVQFNFFLTAILPRTVVTKTVDGMSYPNDRSTPGSPMDEDEIANVLPSTNG